MSGLWEKNVEKNIWPRFRWKWAKTVKKIVRGTKESVHKKGYYAVGKKFKVWLGYLWMDSLWFSYKVGDGETNRSEKIKETFKERMAWCYYKNLES